jgi:hypothetical protein
MARTKTVTKATIKRERTPGGDIPETVATYIAAHPEQFQEYMTFDKDTERICAMSKKGIELEDAQAIAWLLWRARLVFNWTRDSDRQPTLDWELAVESAWLKDELFRMCKDKRSNFYEAQQARRERLEGIKLCLTGTKGVKLADDVERGTKEEKVAELKTQREGDAVTQTIEAINALDTGVL